MGVRVLSLHPADLVAAVPQWDTSIAAADVGIAIIDGSTGEWDATAGASEAILPELAAAPVITVAVAPEGELHPSAQAVIDACDLLIRAEDRAGVERLVELIDEAPAAALVAAQVLRTGRGQVLDESFAYSMLLGGERFRRWRAENEVHPADDGDVDPRVTVQDVSGTWLIRLCRPERHNAFDSRMREELCDALDAVTSSRPAPVVIVGEGPSFCSGGDLDEFGSATDLASAHVVRTGRSVARRLQRISDRLIVGVHGHCIGAGDEFAAFASVVVAAQDTSFALPELSLGLNLGAGGTISIPRRIGRRRTLEMLLSPTPIDAATALQWGLVDELVQPSDVESRCMAIASAMQQEN